jgi:hypothetical protein
MIPGSCSLLLPGLLAFGEPQLVDRVALVFVDEAKAKRPVVTFSHDLLATPTDCVGSLHGSEPKVQTTTKKNSYFASFAADFDGDQEDELVVCREKKSSGAVSLAVYPFPGKVNDSAAQLASFTSLGSTQGDLRIVALGAADVNGDGEDELLIVREGAVGVESLAIHALPNTKKELLGATIASDGALAANPDEVIVGIAGVEYDANPGDELAILFRSPSTGDRIAIFAAPASVDGDTGAALGEYGGLSGPDTRVESIARAHSGGVDRLLLVIDTAGARRAEVHPLPPLGSGALSTPLAADTTLVIGPPTFRLAVVIGHRKFVDPSGGGPPSGTYQKKYAFRAVIPLSQGATGVTVTDDFFGVNYDGASTFEFKLPGLEPFSGQVINVFGDYRVDMVPDMIVNTPLNVINPEGITLALDAKYLIDWITVYFDEGGQPVGYQVVGGGALYYPGTTNLYGGIKYWLALVELP